MAKLPRFVSLMMLSCALLASVAQAAPTITRVVGDLSMRTLTITGTQLPTARNKDVTFGGIVLSVTSRSPTRIVATLPVGIGPGTYPLHIEAGPEIDVTLTGALAATPSSSSLFFMGSTNDLTTRAAARKWLPPVGFTETASLNSVAGMMPGPNNPVTVHTLRVKKFSLTGLAPAIGNIVVAVVAQRDDDTTADALLCTIAAGQSQCTSSGSIDLNPSENFVIRVVHSANQDPSGVAWSFEAFPR